MFDLIIEFLRLCDISNSCVLKFFFVPIFPVYQVFKINCQWYELSEVVQCFLYFFKSWKRVVKRKWNIFCRFHIGLTVFLCTSCPPGSRLSKTHQLACAWRCGTTHGAALIKKKDRTRKYKYSHFLNCTRTQFIISPPLCVIECVCVSVLSANFLKYYLWLGNFDLFFFSSSLRSVLQFECVVFSLWIPPSLRPFCVGSPPSLSKTKAKRK